MRLLITALFLSTACQGENLRVMSFNILFGGKYAAHLNEVAEVIRRSRADLVGVQEQDGNGKRLADLLGFHSYPIKHGPAQGGIILSRYPIERGFEHGAEILLPSGRRAQFFSVHLRPSPYQPWDIRDGKIVSEEQAIASAHLARGGEIKSILEEITPFVNSSDGVFLVGDFNEPSHLDWTERASMAGLHAMKVNWPTSNDVLRAGLLDAFRVRYPDEVKYPGYTWNTYDSAGEVHDRIDFLYYAGKSAELRNVQIAGEAGNPMVDIIGMSPYPSDHRAVVGEFSLK